VLHELVEGAREHLRGDGLTPRAAEVATGRGRGRRATPGRARTGGHDARSLAQPGDGNYCNDSCNEGRGGAWWRRDGA
jgi:hypothetical protein